MDETAVTTATPPAPTRALPPRNPPSKTGRPTPTAQPPSMREDVQSSRAPTATPRTPDDAPPPRPRHPPTTTRRLTPTALRSVACGDSAAPLLPPSQPVRPHLPPSRDLGPKTSPHLPFSGSPKLHSIGPNLPMPPPLMMSHPSSTPPTIWGGAFSNSLD